MVLYVYILEELIYIIQSNIYISASPHKGGSGGGRWGEEARFMPKEHPLILVPPPAPPPPPPPPLPLPPRPPSPLSLSFSLSVTDLTRPRRLLPA